MDAPVIPSELVEAAAKAAMEAEPGQNWECATAKEADVYLRDSLAVLAAVLPLIEQRVIDKLAREAAGGPVPDDHPGVLASLGPLCTLTMDTSERERVKMAQIVIHAARPYLAACGVAAERARWARKIAEAFASGDEQLGIVLAAEALAALAPERTTGEET